jgi:hypothetical protein
MRPCCGEADFTSMSQQTEGRRAEIKRIDAAHDSDGDKVFHVVRAATRVPLAVTAEEETASQDEQLRLQAEQLADHLRGQLGDLDQRESLLNTRTAALESELRLSRLWLQEREHELAERQAALDRQEAELREHVRQFAVEQEAAGAQRQHQVAELQARERILGEREEQLAEHQRRFAAAAQSLQIERDTWTARRNENEQRLAAQCQELVERQNSVRELEAALHQDRHRLASEQNEFRELHQNGQRALEKEREFWQEKRLELEQLHATNDQILAAQRERLELREAALQQLHAEAVRARQDAVELRLVTEQLWTQCCAQVPASQLVEALGPLRAELAEHFRTVQQSLKRERAALVDAALRLDAKALELRQRRRELEAWLEQQAEPRAA